MSKAYELISESLNEIIEDLEKNCGKNLHRETLTEEKNISTTFESNSISNNSFKNLFNDKISNVTI